MANRRMFSLKVIDTDDFLDMPISTRLLYYDLTMRADDDGFLSNPKKIMKIVGCSDDDFKILIAKKYIIPFHTGICVIRHWYVHNLIRGDRYHETECKEEISKLKLLNNKYEFKDNYHNFTSNVIPPDNQSLTKQLNVNMKSEAGNEEIINGIQLVTDYGIPDVNQLAPQYKLSKDNLSKDNTELKKEKEKEKERKKPVDIFEILKESINLEDLKRNYSLYINDLDSVQDKKNFTNLFHEIKTKNEKIIFKKELSV
jgi:hypothetical protein